MLLITYQGRAAVWVLDGQAHLTPAIAVLEGDHPVRRWACCMGYFALCIQDGAIDGEFTASRAEHFARCALLPVDEFEPVAHRDDVVLAEQFGVPVEQIHPRRLELGLATARGISRSG